MEIIDSVKSQDISAVLQYYHQQLGNSYLLQKTIRKSRRYYAPTQGGVLGWVKAKIRYDYGFPQILTYVFVLAHELLIRKRNTYTVCVPR